MSPGETARTVIAMLEADLDGGLTEHRFAELLSDDVNRVGVSGDLLV